MRTARGPALLEQEMEEGPTAPDRFRAFRDRVAEVARVLDEHNLLVADEALPAPSNPSSLPSTA